MLVWRSVHLKQLCCDWGEDDGAAVVCGDGYSLKVIDFACKCCAYTLAIHVAHSLRSRGLYNFAFMDDAGDFLLTQAG